MTRPAGNRIPEGKIVLTYEDYVRLPDDRNRYEILDGELAVTPAPSPEHQRVSLNLTLVLGNHVRALKLGHLYCAPIDLILAPTTVLQPDLAFIRFERQGIVTARGIEGSPDLVIEILSPGTARTDRTTKAHLYARYAVHHYWLVDPEPRALEAYSLAGETYRLDHQLSGPAEFTPALFAGLTIRLADLWD